MTLDQTALAPRMAHIKPFVVMEIQRRAFELEATGRNIIHLEIGQPDFGAPPSVVSAATHALQSDPLGYTGALGIMPLRRAIAQWYRERFNVVVSAEQIIVTAGASGAFLIVCGSLIGSGDEVLMPDPCYPCNRHFVRMFEGVPVTIAAGARQNYQLDAATVQAHWGAKTRAAMLATPSNPTGTEITADALRDIATVVRDRRGLLIVDEIYQALSYADEHGQRQDGTVLSYAPEAIVINSFSKYFGMTGWRLGWIVAPAPLVAQMERFAQNAFICPSAPAQHAALAALQPEAITVFEQRRVEFERRRDYIVPALRALGFSIPTLPTGAFYVYADCSRLTDDSARFAWDVLEQAGVAITPGGDFGNHQAERYVRFAYTRSMNDLREGVQRLARFLGRPVPSG